MKYFIICVSTFVMLTGCQPRVDDHSQSSQVAKVKISTLETSLRQRVFAKPENQSLKIQYDALEARRKVQSTEILKRYEKSRQTGKVELFDNPRPDLSAIETDNAIKEAVDGLIRKELVGLIETQFKGKYDVVIQQEYRENVIYSKYQVADITSDLLPIVLGPVSSGK